MNLIINESSFASWHLIFWSRSRQAFHLLEQTYWYQVSDNALLLELAAGALKFIMTLSNILNWVINLSWVINLFWCFALQNIRIKHTNWLQQYWSKRASFEQFEYHSNNKTFHFTPKFWDFFISICWMGFLKITDIFINNKPKT